MSVDLKLEKTSLQGLKQLLNAVSEDLKVPENDEAFLLKFLRTSKYDVAKAFDRIQNYFKGWIIYPDSYSNLKPSTMLHHYKHNIQGFLPGIHVSGRRVFYVNFANWNLNQSTMHDIYRANVLCIEKVADENEAQLLGIMAVVNLEGVGFAHVRKANFYELRKVLTLIQKRIPLRFASIHLVNEPAVFNWSYKLMYPLLSLKFRERLVFHGRDYEGLHKIVGKDILPAELGGSQPTFENSRFVKELLEWEPNWIRYRNYGYVEQ